MYQVPDVSCNQEGCTNTYKDHRWGKIRAHDAGWFFQKDGIVWCPEHVPEWVWAWRAGLG